MTAGSFHQKMLAYMQELHAEAIRAALSDHTSLSYTKFMNSCLPADGTAGRE